jgi:opacity protein-like surface antigen
MRKALLVALMNAAFASRLLGAQAADLGVPVDLTPAALDFGSQAFRHDDLATMTGPDVLETAKADGSSIWPAHSDEKDVPLEPVSWNRHRSDRRFYISGLLGPSFASLSDPIGTTTDDILAAGGSIGISFERARGRLRIETEGVWRDMYFGQVTPVGGGLFAFSNWSVMENVWRDVMLTDRLGIYGGGGIGAGGYRYAVGNLQTGTRIYGEPGAAFAWQVGGGLTYEITDRLTFDVGYRYFNIDTIRSQSTLSPAVTPSQFAASELMFSLRFYEPFRAWAR